MPELPEVETIRRDLEREVVGRRIADVSITGARTVRRGTPAGTIAALAGARLVAAERRGKYLVLPLDSGWWLVVHLRMSGQLRKAAPGEPRPKHTHAVLTVADGPGRPAAIGPAGPAGPAGIGPAGPAGRRAVPSSPFEVRFVDPRTFGELFVAHPADLAAVAPQLAGLGVDPFSGLGSAGDFARVVLAGRTARLKDLLTDQRVVAGLGNIYSDEILHHAGLRPDRRADTLTLPERRRLFRAVQAVLPAAVAARGSSLGDNQYVDLYGRPGRFREQHQVYGRAGGACYRCRHTVERARWQGRFTFFCPACQS